MEMPARTFSSPLYRYGFNGKEKDDEAKGSGAQYDYGFRIYDPRVGRFLSVDPLTKKFAFFSPYHYAGNSTIKNIDLDGAEPAGNPWDWNYIKNDKSYDVRMTNKNTGETQLATARQFQVKDKVSDQIWRITTFTYTETGHWGNSEKATMYAWYNEDQANGLPQYDARRWTAFKPDIVKEKEGVRKTADAIGVATFGGAVIGAAAPAVLELAPSIVNGLANEASLLKYTPKSYGAYAKLFGANLGLQFTFNGKNADVWDAATSTINPWAALLTNPVMNYKPLAGDSHPTIGTDSPEVMAKKFVISAPFTALGMTVNTIQPNFTTDYLINTSEQAADAAIPDPKTKK